MYLFLEVPGFILDPGCSLLAALGLATLRAPDATVRSPCAVFQGSGPEVLPLPPTHHPASFFPSHTLNNCCFFPVFLKRLCQPCSSKFTQIVYGCYFQVLPLLPLCFPERLAFPSTKKFLVKVLSDLHIAGPTGLCFTLNSTSSGRLPVSREPVLSWVSSHLLAAPTSFFAGFTSSLLPPDREMFQGSVPTAPLLLPNPDCPHHI